MSLSVYLYEDLNFEEELYWANITHNLSDMAEAAGIYQALWRPDEINAKQAKDILDIILNGFCKLLKNPDEYRKLEASNGWGTYENFIDWIFRYIKALSEYPESYILALR